MPNDRGRGIRQAAQTDDPTRSSTRGDCPWTWLPDFVATVDAVVFPLLPVLDSLGAIGCNRAIARKPIEIGSRSAMPGRLSNPGRLSGPGRLSNPGRLSGPGGCRARGGCRAKARRWAQFPDGRRNRARIPPPRRTAYAPGDRRLPGCPPRGRKPCWGAPRRRRGRCPGSFAVWPADGRLAMPVLGRVPALGREPALRQSASAWAVPTLGREPALGAMHSEASRWTRDARARRLGRETLGADGRGPGGSPTACGSPTGGRCSHRHRRPATCHHPAPAASHPRRPPRASSSHRCHQADGKKHDQ